MQWILLKKQTKVCKVCFNEFENNMLHGLFTGSASICSRCLRKYNPKFYHYKFKGHKCMAIYDYADSIKEKLYLFKGCHDYELFDTFVYPYANDLKIKYRDFLVIPIPSSEKDDEKRGFNHVKEMFGFFKESMRDILRKVGDHKQAKLGYEERKNIQNHIELTREIPKHKKLLIVDDVMTTGSTISCALNLLKKFEPKRIEILVMSKTIYDERKSLKK